MRAFMYICNNPKPHHMKQAVTVIGILMISIIFAVQGKSQELKISDYTNKYTVENVIVTNSIPKDTLFKRTLKSLYKIYPNSGEKGTLISTAGNKIIASQYFNPDPNNLWNMTNLRIGFMLTFEIKKQNLNYIFTDFYYFSAGNGKVLFDSRKFEENDIKIRDGMLNESNKYIKKTIAEITESVLKNK
jgi:hypothetical protein